MAKVSKLQLTGIVAATLAAAGVTYGVLKPEPNQSAERGATLTPTIEIVTTNAKPLTFEMSTATVDLIARKRNVWFEIDPLEPAYVAKMKALGFGSVWVFADASIENYAYPAAPPLVGHGYNAKPSDFATQQLFDDYGNGILKFSFPSDFFNKTIEFSRALGIKNHVTLNKKETWAESDYKIKNSTGEYIKLGSEVVTTSWKWEDYLLWAKKTRDSIIKYYPTKKIIAEEPNLFKYNRQSTEWRANINPTSLTGMYGGRVYWQIHDQVNLTLNQDVNIERMKVFFNDSIPAQIAQFQRLFPTWKIFATEIVVVDNRPEADSVQFINKSIVGSYAWGRYFQSFIENQDIQPLAIQMSLRGLDNPTETNAKTLTLLNKLLKAGFNVTAATFTNMDGVTGASINSVSNKKEHAILINNSSKNSYTLTSIKIDGKKKTPNSYILERIYTSDATWNNPVVTTDSISSTSIIIPGCSVSVVSFQTGASADK